MAGHVFSGAYPYQKRGNKQRQKSVQKNSDAQPQPERGGAKKQPQDSQKDNNKTYAQLRPAGPEAPHNPVIHYGTYRKNRLRPEGNERAQNNKNKSARESFFHVSLLCGMENLLKPRAYGQRGYEFYAAAYPKKRNRDLFARIKSRPFLEVPRYTARPAASKIGYTNFIVKSYE
jgi:hypothetical protein